MTAPYGYLRVGSVSLGSARKAARAAKADTPERAKDKASPAVLERYLGHFGSGTRKPSAKESSAHGLSTKKASAKKAGGRKSLKAHARKKASVKKASTASKKR